MKEKESVYKSKKITQFIVCFVFAMLIVYFIFRDNQLSKHGILLQGKSTTWGSSATMGYNLSYFFFYKGKRIESANSFSSLTDKQDFENKDFPVLYDTTLGTSQLLIRPVDFEAYQIPFPDSLSWVLKYIK